MGDVDAGTDLDARAAQLLQQAGQRVTRPRLAVLTCLLSFGDRHVAADEVFEHLSKTESTAHRATVYRTLESLTAVGVLRHVHLDRGLTVYHTVPVAAAESHLHAQCSECGAVVDLPPGVLGDTAERIKSVSGFDLDAAHIALSGLCAQCSTPSGARHHH